MGILSFRKSSRSADDDDDADNLKPLRATDTFLVTQIETQKVMFLVVSPTISSD